MVKLLPPLLLGFLCFSTSFGIPLPQEEDTPAPTATEVTNTAAPTTAETSKKPSATTTDTAKEPAPTTVEINQDSSPSSLEVSPSTVKTKTGAGPPVLDRKLWSESIKEQELSDDFAPNFENFDYSELELVDDEPKVEITEPVIIDDFKPNFENFDYSELVELGSTKVVKLDTPQEIEEEKDPIISESEESEEPEDDFAQKTLIALSKVFDTLPRDHPAVKYVLSLPEDDPVRIEFVGKQNTRIAENPPTEPLTLEKIALLPPSHPARKQIFSLPADNPARIRLTEIVKAKLAEEGRFPPQQSQRFPSPQSQSRLPPPPSSTQSRLPPPPGQSRLPPPPGQSRLPPPPGQSRLPPPPSSSQSRLPPPPSSSQSRLPPPPGQSRLPPPPRQSSNADGALTLEQVALLSPEHPLRKQIFALDADHPDRVRLTQIVKARIAQQQAAFAQQAQQAQQGQQAQQAPPPTQKITIEEIALLPTSHPLQQKIFSLPTDHPARIRLTQLLTAQQAQTSSPTITPELAQLVTQLVNERLRAAGVPPAAPQTQQRRLPPPQSSSRLPPPPSSSRLPPPPSASSADQNKKYTLEEIAHLSPSHPVRKQIFALPADDPIRVQLTEIVKAHIREQQDELEGRLPQSSSQEQIPRLPSPSQSNEPQKFTLEEVALLPPTHPVRKQIFSLPADDPTRVRLTQIVKAKLEARQAQQPRNPTSRLPPPPSSRSRLPPPPSSTKEPQKFTLEQIAEFPPTHPIRKQVFSLPADDPTRVRLTEIVKARLEAQDFQRQQQPRLEAQDFQRQQQPRRLPQSSLRPQESSQAGQTIPVELVAQLIKQIVNERQN